MEVFSSVQGEGPDVGASTLFVRLGGCDLRCRWCDSSETWRPGTQCRLEDARGSGHFTSIPSPLGVDRVLLAARRLEAGAHCFASLTGGEPLLQPAACVALAEGLRAMGPRIHLETHGLHAAALAQVLPHLDVVSMDWKLTSDVRRASDPARGRVEPFHDAHSRFLELAREASRVIVKLVITPSTRDDEVEEAVSRVAALHPGACLVLQPVTPCGGVKRRPTAERMLALERQAALQLPWVRVIPQTHPVYGVR